MIKKIIRISLLVALILGVVVLTNPKELVRLDIEKFDIPACDVTTSKFIIACGIDAKEAEWIYLRVKFFVGAHYVNRPIKVFVANKILNDGIAYLDDTLISGIYRNGILGAEDIIVYNGDTEVLVHEFGHHFFEHMKLPHRHERFASLMQTHMTLISDFITLNQKYEHIRNVLVKQKIREMKNEKNKV